MRSCFCGSIWTDVADLFVSCPAMPGCAVLPRSPTPVVVEVLVADRPVCVFAGLVVFAPVLPGSVLPGSVLPGSVLLASALLASGLSVAAERPVLVAELPGCFPVSAALRCVSGFWLVLSADFGCWEAFSLAPWRAFGDALSRAPGSPFAPISLAAP